MKSFLEFVEEFDVLLNKARKLSPDGDSSLERAEARGRAKVVILSPHPDDECISGALARRFQIEAGAKVTNVAITLGSNKSRRKARKAELKDACKALGWNLKICSNGEGFSSINPNSRRKNPGAWKAQAEELANIISKEKPDVVFAPHKRDWNKTHMGTALLAEDALALLPNFDGYFINTEFWGAMWRANLLVEVSPKVAASLVFGISRHKGEVSRNDYHVRLPAYFADNVRRGGEIVGGMGKEAPRFNMGAIYDAKIRSKDGKWRSAFKGGLFLPTGAEALKSAFGKIF